MVVIRLARGGAKKRPFYSIVIADRRSPRDGRHLEVVGFFNPGARGEEVRLHLEMERVQYWLGTGAQASDRVKSLLKENRQSATANVEIVEIVEKAEKAPAKKASKAPKAEAVAKAPKAPKAPKADVAKEGDAAEAE